MIVFSPISFRVNQTLHLPPSPRGPQNSALWVERGRSVPTVACHSSQNVLWWPALKMASAAVVSAGFLPAVTSHLLPPWEWKEEGGRVNSHSILGRLSSLKRPSEPIPLDMNPQKVHYRKANRLTIREGEKPESWLGPLWSLREMVRLSVVHHRL